MEQLKTFWQKPTNRIVFGLLALCAIILGVVLALIMRRPPIAHVDPSPQTSTTPSVTAPSPETNASPASAIRIYARSIPGVAAAYTFSLEMPAHWELELVPEVEAINLFDPAAAGDTNREKSQVFIRYFRADRFLTLATVDITEQTEVTVGGRPGMRYVIEKKAGVVDFAHQPSWRNAKHTVTDVRVSDTHPSVFYVVASRSDLAPATYAALLDSLRVDDQLPEAAYVAPIAEFLPRITKKSFASLITPATSPVQPERFSGYHTGVDVEYEDVGGSVPVVAVADGDVLSSGTANGYGGMVAIRHAIEGEPYVAIYGHLDPKSLVANGTHVAKGQQIGELGDHLTSETDGERKHLHFALVRGTSVNLRGYVSNITDLNAWADPQIVLKNVSN